MTALQKDDLAAAVSAGHLTEAQAAGLLAFAEERAGLRARLPAEDEPFELFRGLNEIFVSVGLVLLLVGAGMLAALLDTALAAIFVMICGLTWGAAEYFTRRRRMILPSLILAGGFTAFATLVGVTIVEDAAEGFEAPTVFAFAILAALAFFWRFKLPFALFLAGLNTLFFLFALTGTIDSRFFAWTLLDNPTDAFDLNQSTPLALTTLCFGIGAFAVAMGFDMRDPYRVSRFSACAFWLHLLAAPAIVNTLALTLYRSEGAGAVALLALLIFAMSLVALIIDRRSFLLSAVLYIGLLLGIAFEDTSQEVAYTAVFLLLGGTVTLLGAGWTRLRAWIMRALPAFPGKTRLPPYA